MTAQSGRMALLLIIVVLMFFMAFVLTPLALAPLGIFAGLAHGVRAVTWDSWHFRPWFPFFPIWGFSLFFFILWIAVIVWVYKDAEKRGMSGILWALLVFIGNLIGLLIFLIVRQDHPECCAPGTTRTTGAPPAAPSGAPPLAPPAAAGGPQAQQASPASAPTCPSCKKPVEKIFTYCPHCGAALQPLCKNCGKSVDAGWKACPYCGATLRSE